MIVLPQKVVSKLKADQLLGTLYLTHLGYFPKARYHYRERKSGIDEFILVHCIDGQGWYEVSGERYRVEPNGLFLLPKGVPHRYAADDDNPWSIYWIHIAGKLADKFMSSFHSGRDRGAAQRFIPHSDERVEIFDEMYRALERGYSSDNLGYAFSCLWHYLGTLRYSGAFEGLKPGQAETDALADSISYMNENLHRSLSLDELAEHAGYSVSYYSSLFKNDTGYSPIDYYIHLKIQRACQYLDMTTLNVKEIAEKLGYGDNHYFSRLFDKIMGMSPTEYREKQKG